MLRADHLSLRMTQNDKDDDFPSHHSADAIRIKEYSRRGQKVITKHSKSQQHFLG
jgi:hypothetical protein